MSPNDPGTGGTTIRCTFCQTLNRVEPARASSRPRCGDCERPIRLDRPLELLEKDFDRTVVAASIPVLIDFYADWCGPCKLVEPLIDEIAGEREGRILVLKVDIDEAEALTNRLGIRGVPTLILFADGDEVERSAGYEPDRVRRMVDEAA